MGGGGRSKRNASRENIPVGGVYIFLGRGGVRFLDQILFQRRGAADRHNGNIYPFASISAGQICPGSCNGSHPGGI
jgi:hypothetical protein